MSKFIKHRYFNSYEQNGVLHFVADQIFRTKDEAIVNGQLTIPNLLQPGVKQHVIEINDWQHFVDHAKNWEASFIYNPSYCFPMYFGYWVEENDPDNIYHMNYHCCSSEAEILKVLIVDIEFNAKSITPKKSGWFILDRKQALKLSHFAKEF